MIKQLACLLHADIRDVALRGLTCDCFQAVTELGGTHCHLRGKRIHIDTAGLYLLGYEVHGTGQEVLVTGREFLLSVGSPVLVSLA